MTCDRCGATVKDAGAFCSYCGGRLAKPERTGTELEKATDPARFDLARANPAFQTALTHEPHPPVVANVMGPMVIGIAGAVFLVFVQSLQMREESSLTRAMFVIIPASIIVVAIVLFVKGVNFAAAPVVRDVRVVVDERVEVSSGGNNRSTTQYYATLQDRDGHRVEYKTYGWLAGRIAATDIGVAFVKRGYLVDFLTLHVG